MSMQYVRIEATTTKSRAVLTSKVGLDTRHANHELQQVNTIKVSMCGTNIPWRVKEVYTL